MADNIKDVDLQMQADNLYLEEVFTDRHIGSIQRLTPVDGAGARDSARPVLYVGQTQLMTPAGALPISFEIEADSLGDAAAKFGDEARKAVEETMERLKEMRREAASSLYVPGSGQGGGLGGAGGPAGGAAGPGGGIQIP
ncbi:MAG: hypothetical protein PVJ40_09605 [Gammaproteobacteria bacterium]|jgi:hypothetical protein